MYIANYKLEHGVTSLTTAKHTDNEPGPVKKQMGHRIKLNILVDGDY